MSQFGTAETEVCERLRPVIKVQDDATGLFDSGIIDSTIIERADGANFADEIAEQIDAVGSEVHKAPHPPLSSGLGAPFVWRKLVLFQKRHASVDNLPRTVRRSPHVRICWKQE